MRFTTFDYVLPLASPACISRSCGPPKHLSKIEATMGCRLLGAGGPRASGRSAESHTRIGGWHRYRVSVPSFVILSSSAACFGTRRAR